MANNAHVCPEYDHSWRLSGPPIHVGELTIFNGRLGKRRRIMRGPGWRGECPGVAYGSCFDSREAMMRRRAKVEGSIRELSAA